MQQKVNESFSLSSHYKNATITLRFQKLLGEIEKNNKVSRNSYCNCIATVAINTVLSMKYTGR